MFAKRHFIPDCQKGLRLFLLLTLIFSLASIGDTGWTAEGLFIDVPISLTLNAQIEKVQPHPTIIRSRFIKVNFDHLGKSLLPEAADPVSLNLFEDAFFVARTNRVERRSETRFSWFGHIEGEENSQVILVVEDGILAGNITLYGHIYHVRFIGDGVHAVQEIDQSGFPDEAPPIPIQYPLTPEVSAAPETEQDSCDTIDVLVVYTAAAVTGAGGTAAMTSLIQLAIDETNQSYANSNITQRVRLVHSQQVTYTETGNLCDGTGNSDLYRLQNSSDGYMDSVHTLRDTYEADIVVLLVENGGSDCGCSFMQGTVSASFQDHAFAVVARNCATGYYSFGHEMGHVMGARHDWYVDNTNGSPYTYNHGYVYEPSRWRTIMAYNDDCYDSGFNCTRIPYWSNPLVTYGGIPMGVAEGSYHAADNRKTLNNTACTVANFRTSITPSQKPNLTPYKPTAWSDKIVVSNVTGTNTDSSPLYSTDTLYADWAVLNNGSVGTGGGFSVALYVDGVLKNTFSRTTSLDVNYYWYWSDYLIGSLTTGTHTIRIVADSSGVIDESNEGDNEYTKTITVQSTCSYSISPSSNSFTAAAGTGSVNVDCGCRVFLDSFDQFRELGLDRDKLRLERQRKRNSQLFCAGEQHG